MSRRRGEGGRRGAAALGGVLLVAGVLAIAAWLLAGRGGRAPTATAAWSPTPSLSPSPTPSRTPTRTPEPLLPTAGPAAESSATPSVAALTAGPTAGPAAPRLPDPTVARSPAPVTAPPAITPGRLADRERIGFAAPESDLASYDVARLGAGWYLTGRPWQPAGGPAGLEFAPLVEVMGATFSPDAQELTALAARWPGALWLVGNEPDVIWQDNATPDEYARAYHDVYVALKAGDPTCRVAIGGVAQVTPLRLRYLDAVLAAYEERYGQAMPVEVWNVHLAILREERGSWGVDIPPGLADGQGMLYEIQDNASVAILKHEVRTMRRWMARHGLRDRPLIVSEFSVLMPPEYGFDGETVRSFMTAAFDYLLAATDEETGYPADGNRLVQRAAWYSLTDRVYSTGNLFDHETRRITPLGQAFARYTAGR